MISGPSDATFFLQQATLAAIPLVAAGVGELVSEKSGTINVGIEGSLLIGCFAAYAAAAYTGSGYAGVLAAMAAAMMLALVFAVVTVWFKADQIVAGTAITLLAAGVSATAWKFLQGAFPELPVGAGFDPVRIPVAAEIPLIGPSLFGAYGILYVLMGLCVAVWGVFRFTRAGLILTALGDAPDACHAAGIRVRAWRTGCILFAGAVAGLAGSYLSIMRTHTFSPDMTGGQGFLVLALVIFGRWNIWGLIAGCLLFGGLDAAQRSLQSNVQSGQIPYQVFKMLPYVATLVALTFLSRSHQGPETLGQPWPRER